MDQITKTHGFVSLTPAQKASHRTKIGLRAEAILGQFWRNDDTPDAVRALEIEGWMDVLENCSHTEIREAWAAYQKNGARTERGRLYKPDAGALYRIIIAARPKPRVVQSARSAESERIPASTEARQRILMEVYGADQPPDPAPKRFGKDDAAQQNSADHHHLTRS